MTTCRTVIPLQARQSRAAPRAAPPAGRARPAGPRRRGGPSARAGCVDPGGSVLPWKRFQLRTSTGTSLRAMRVVVADPPAFTPPYDHALAAALARAGADVELVTSRFRFGDVPQPDGYRRRELFYPLSSRLFRRSQLRLPLKALEHPLGLARLAAGAGRRRAPAVARRARARRPAPPPRAPLVLTAHDLLPRRTAKKDGPLAPPVRPLRAVVVHTERGRETLAEFGVAEEKLRVIPHPVFPGSTGAARRRPHGARARAGAPVQAARPRARGGRRSVDGARPAVSRATPRSS